MPSVGKVNGTAFGVYVDNVLIGFGTNCSMSVSKEPRNCTTSVSGMWTSRMQGSNDWEISCDHLLSMQGTTQMWYQLYSGYMSNPNALVTVKFKTTVSGDRYFQGSAILTGISLEAAMEETATFSCSFVGAGPLTLLQV